MEERQPKSLGPFDEHILSLAHCGVHLGCDVGQVGLEGLDLFGQPDLAARPGLVGRPAPRTRCSHRLRQVLRAPVLVDVLLLDDGAVGVHTDAISHVQGFDFVQQDFRVDEHAGPDQQPGRGVDEPARKLAHDELLTSEVHGMAGVGADTGPADDSRPVGRGQVGRELAFALVAPESAGDDRNAHVSTPFSITMLLLKPRRPCAYPCLHARRDSRSQSRRLTFVVYV